MSDPKESIELIHGLPESMRSAAVALYDEAFGPKFAIGIPSRSNRISLLTESLNLDFAFGAIADGQLVGLAGYKTSSGSFTDGMTYAKLLKHAGLLRGNWSAIVFSFYERSLVPDQLLMDGIVVDATMRGCGIGTRLLTELCGFALSSGHASVRLDVIDTNPRARKMYERHGFVATRTNHFEYLRWLFRFGSSTTLACDVAATKNKVEINRPLGD